MTMTSKTRLLVSTMLAGFVLTGAGSTLAQTQATQEAQSALSPAGPPGAPIPQAPGAQADARQGSAAPADVGGSLIQEIVITAEKREQSLQQVPVAVSAFTAAKRDLIGIQSVVDQTNYTPGLTYQPSLDRLSTRGVGRLTNSHAADSGTAIYIDGVFTTSTFEAGRDPIFVDRTEVLRGPQGTLYGRNAIGGAFNVISKRPTKDFSADARVTFANYDRKQVAGAVSIPLADNMRVKFGYERILQGEGYFNNLSAAPGLRFTTANGIRDQQHIEAQFQGEFGKLDVWAYYGKEIWNDSATPGTTTNGGTLAPAEISPFVGAGSISLTPIASYGFTGGLNTQFSGPIRGNAVLATGDPRVLQTNTAFKNTLHDTDIARTHLTYHFDNFDLKYIGGFTRYNYKYVNDTDGTSITSYQIPIRAGTTCAQLAALGLCAPLTVYPSVTNTYQEDEEFYSHEFNISSTWDKPLNYIVGLYYYHEKYQYPQNVTQPNQPQLGTPTSAIAGLTVPANPTRTLLHTNNFFGISSKAAFAQVDYKLFDTFKLTGGVRYTSDEKKGVEEQRTICFALPACGIDPSALGSLIGTGGIPAVGVPAIPGAIDITLAQTGTASPAQVASLVTTGAAGGGGQQGVIGYTYDRNTGYLKRNLRDGWNAFTGTAGVEWTPDRKTLVYGKYSRGYKAGGFNTAVGSSFSQAPYSKPEQMDALETGVKKDWSRRLQTNVSAFYNIYYDAQVPLTITQATGPNIGIFYNVPRSIIQGVELETVWNPIDRLNINFTYAYLDSHVSKACCVSDPNDPAAVQPGAQPVAASTTGGVDPFTGLPTRGQNLKGNKLPLSPEHKIALNGNYTFDLGRFGTLITSASYLWRDEQYSSIFSRDYNLAPSRSQVDLRVTYKEPNARYTIIGYVQNPDQRRQLRNAGRNPLLQRHGLPELRADRPADLRRAAPGALLNPVAPPPAWRRRIHDTYRSRARSAAAGRALLSGVRQIWLYVADITSRPQGNRLSSA